MPATLGPPVHRGGLWIGAWAVGLILLVVVVLLLIEMTVRPAVLSLQNCPVPDAYGNLPSGAPDVCHP